MKKKQEHMKAYQTIINSIFFCLLLVTSTACQKTLDVDYDEISPLLVVEGSVSNEGVSVLINESRDMKDSTSQKGIDGATVIISGSDGYYEKLEFGDGKYYSPSNYAGVPGEKYTIDVTYKDKHCTAESVMPPAIEIDSVKFKWMHIMGDIYIRTCYIYFQDDPDNTNYYFASLRRNMNENKDLMKQETVSDEGFNEKYNYISLAFMSKNNWEDAEKKKKRTGEIDPDYLYEGDRAVVELRSLDFNAFNFAKTGDKNQSSAINPSTNLVGDNCVGYFSAYAVSKMHLTYTSED